MSTPLTGPVLPDDSDRDPDPRAAAASSAPPRPSSGAPS